MFDDPLTARILLLAHRREYNRGNITTPLSHKHLMYLYDLNWKQRKDVMLASFNTTSRELWTSSAVLRKKIEREYERRKKGESNARTLTQSISTAPPNIFSRLREFQLDCFMLVVSYV